MTDKTFQWSMIGVTVVALALIIVLGILWSWVSILIGIVFELIAGGLLLRSWGKAYMVREVEG